MRTPTGPTTVVVGGVSGAGKSVTAAALASRLGWPFLDADDLHPSANVVKMADGHPLDEADRAPWLAAVAAWVGRREEAGEDAVVACSALRRDHRDVLREGHPSVLVTMLEVDPALVAARLASRSGHFMPAELLGSQLAAFEDLDADEDGVRLPVPASWSPEETAARMETLLALRPARPAVSGDPP